MVTEIYHPAYEVNYFHNFKHYIRNILSTRILLLCNSEIIKILVIYNQITLLPTLSYELSPVFPIFILSNKIYSNNLSQNTEIRGEKVSLPLLMRGGAKEFGWIYPRSRGYPETGRVSRARPALSARLPYLCTLFLPRHGSSCEPEAAESSWRDITMSPLHSFRRRSPAFFCVFSPFSSGSTRTKYRGVARVCPADGSQVTCCY